MEDKKKIDDLEHELLRVEMSGLKSRMHEGFSSIEDTITKGFKLMEAENKRQNDISDIQRKQILKKQDLTNGRVTALEVVTTSLKYLQEHKKVAVLVFWGAYNALDWASVRTGIIIYEWIQSLT